MNISQIKNKFSAISAETLELKFSAISAETLELVAIIIIHCATLPSMFAIFAGLTDKVPQVDIILFVWIGLMLFFFRAIIQKSMLILFVIGLGFIIQSIMMILIYFR